MSKPFDLKFIPFSQLHISKLNMRHSETAPEIDDILPSIKTRGIRQPLIVRREGGTAKKPKYGIVAGRRRWFCRRVRHYGQFREAASGTWRTDTRCS